MANDILITTESLKNILPVYENNILNKVKNETPKITEPMDDDLPTVFISGTIPESKTYVSGELEYISKTTKFHAYTLIKLQGNSTLAFPKKNYTVVLYTDDGRSIPLNKEFKNWGSHNNFVLKADYIDILHARNIVSAKLWSKVVQSRNDYDILPNGIKNSPNNGVVDGFPVKVYINGMYCGLYSWTIPKCDWMVGMNASNTNHILLSAEFNDNGDTTYQNNPCNFNTLWDGNSDYFDVEIGTNSTTLVSSLNVVISAIMNSNQAELYQVLDVQGAIDYFIFQNIILGTDGLAKNMLLATYDMTKWYLCAYDMDSTFGLDWNGNILLEGANSNDLTLYNNQFSKLWIYITQNYQEAIVQRYTELRKTVLSYSSIMEEFEKYIGIFGEDIYIQDTINFPDIPSVSDNTLNLLRNFIANRLNYLDNEFGVVI